MQRDVAVSEDGFKRQQQRDEKIEKKGNEKVPLATKVLLLNKGNI